VTQYNPETGEGGNSVDYVKTFLKLRGEANGYPGWVQSPEGVDRHVESFWTSEGIRLEKKRSGITLPNEVWSNSVSTPCGGNWRGTIGQ